MTDRILAADNVQDSPDTCTPVDPKSVDHLRAGGNGGLPMNGFVCYDRNLIQEEYLQCPAIPLPAPTEPEATESEPVSSPTEYMSSTAVPSTSASPPTPTSSGNPLPTSTNGNLSPTSSCFYLQSNVMTFTILLLVSNFFT